MYLALHDAPVKSKYVSEVNWIKSSTPYEFAGMVILILTVHLHVRLSIVRPWI